MRPSDVSPRLARALFVLLACAVALVPANSPAATNNQTPFSKLPRLFFGETPAPMMPASAVVARYGRTLESVRSPRYLAFSFSIEQVGSRILSQSHRVFRDGLNERDETVVVDGQALPRPDVRIFRNRTYHYDLAAVAPRPDDYDFKLTGTQHDGDHDDYLFDTASRSDRGFAVTSVVIDGDRFLPIEIDFHIASGSMHGQGRLLYGQYDKYWLVREAGVTAHDESGAASRERIVWSQYQFPESLPASTFSSHAPADVEPDVEAPQASPSQPPASVPAAPAAAPPQIGPATSHPAAPVSTPKPAVASAHPHPKPVVPAAAGTPALLEGPVTPAPLREETPIPAAPLETAAPAPAATAAATGLPGANGAP